MKRKPARLREDTAAYTTPAAPRTSQARSSSLLDTRVIYCGDNLDQLRKLPAASVDLIYIDPPFNSATAFSAGWGDSVSWGGTRAIRHLFPDFYMADECSFAYKAGQVFGVVNSLAMGSGLAFKSFGAADRVLAGTARSGIYRFTGQTTRKYIGQSGNVPGRLARHASKWKLPAGETAQTWEVAGGKLARERAEQAMINRVGLRNLENVRNPMGGRPELYRWLPTTGEAALAGGSAGLVGGLMAVSE